MTVACDNRMLDEMRDAIVEAVHPAKIILFGSRGRHDPQSDSDVDLLIVDKESFGPNRSRRAVMHRIRQALSRFRIPKDILVYSEEEVRHWAPSLNHAIAVALREGVVLYEGP